MLGRAATFLVLTAVLAAPAHAQPVELMPGVIFDRTVEFTPHGVVVLNVITAPRPGSGDGLYQLEPVLAGGSVAAPPQRLSGIEQGVSASATVAGVNGDFFAARTAQPAGAVLSAGVLEHPPAAGRSSIGLDTSGVLHVDRVRLFGTWRGTGQRRTLDVLNKAPALGQVALFTPAYGAAVPVVAGSTEAILGDFPAAVPNIDLHATVAAVGIGGGEAIPPGGAVLQAAGALAPKLQAEAPAGTPVTVRLGLQPAWAGIVSALGGGPLLVTDGKPVFRSFEDFVPAELNALGARAAVGQLRDGRVVLVAVDGGQPGYSAGLTNYELAKAMVSLGCVTAAGLQSGPAAGAAFDGRLLSHPSHGEQPVKEALLVEYSGVYVPQLPAALLTGEPGLTSESLAYRLVRPSVVTAALVAPDGTTRMLVGGLQEPPGSYAQTYSTFDEEGVWRWTVSAIDDLGRSSTAERTFRYDTTLVALAAPKLARGSVAITFTLSRPATVRLVIETPSGIRVQALRPVVLGPGRHTLTWDGRLPLGARAYAGSYVAHVFARSGVGTSDRTVGFSLRRR